MYAERMNRLCKMEVREAKNGDRILPGLVLLAIVGAYTIGGRKLQRENIIETIRDDTL
jgi:two-component system chemotaxis response regulator CheB